MIFPDKFIDQDKPEEMYKIAGMDSISIVEKILNTLNSKIVLKKQISFCIEHYSLKSGPTKHNSSLLLQSELLLYQRTDRVCL